MPKDETKEFDFDDNDVDKYSDAIFQDEMKDMRLEKLNQRVTIITILIPCLIGIILFIAYRDLTGRVTETEFSGSKEIQALSAELEKELTAITTQQSEFQATLTSKIAGIEKTLSELDQKSKTANAALKQVKQDLEKTGAALKSVSALKVDKKDQKAAIDKINNTLIPIRRDLESLPPLRNNITNLSNNINVLSSKIKAVDKRVQEKLSSVTASMRKTNRDLGQLQSNLTAMENEKMDQASLELEMLKARKSLERTFDQELIKVQRRIDALLKRTKQLETNLKQLEATATKIPAAKTPVQTKTPESIKIEEQDLKE
jgi:septal ring factor EnvC (AmiA/AmiB activator)